MSTQQHSNMFLANIFALSGTFFTVVFKTFFFKPCDIYTTKARV